MNRSESFTGAGGMYVVLSSGRQCEESECDQRGEKAMHGNPPRDWIPLLCTGHSHAASIAAIESRPDLRDLTCLRETLYLATAADAAYLLPLQVALASLAERLRSSLRPVVYLLNRQLTAAQLESVGGHAEIRSVVPAEQAMQLLPRQPGFAPEAAFPLLLADLLPPSVDRVLFIDPDLLVLDDVGKIWDRDLGENVVGAVTDQAIPTVSSPRGLKDWHARDIPADAPYFNGGVLLVDLDRWRSQDVTARVRKYLEADAGQVDFFHQEALNAILWDKWLQLDQRWNLVASLAGRPYGPGNPVAVESPGIVHFAGRFKPWRVRVGGPFARAYQNQLHRCGLDSDNHTTAEKLLGIYDRYLRDYLYGTEHLLWKHRLI